MSGFSTREHDAAASAKQAQSATDDYQESTKLANDKTTQCTKFLTFARHIRDQANFSCAAPASIQAKRMKMVSEVSNSSGKTCSTKRCLEAQARS